MHFQTTKTKSLKKITFLTSGVTTKIKSVKKLIFNVWNGQKRVLMNLRILPDHQNQVLKKWSG